MGCSREVCGGSVWAGGCGCVWVGVVCVCVCAHTYMHE